MDGPVLSPRLAELAGAVERVDDPGAAAALRCARPLLGEDGIAGALVGEPADDQLVREPVAVRAQRGWVSGVSSDREQKLRSLARHACGEVVIVRSWRPRHVSA